MGALRRADRIFVAIVFLGIFGMAARNVTDPDVWWHLKTGQYISQHGSVPHADPFSYTRANQPWVAHEWLTEVLMYRLWRATGMGGLIVLFAVIICAAFFVLYRRCGPNAYVAGVATLYGAWATMPVWGVRPQVVSLLLMSVWLFLLEKAEKDLKILWWTLPLTVLWVNLHAGFALGLALSALFLLGEFVEKISGRAGQNKGFQISCLKTSYLKTSALILLLDLALVPLNPNGLRMFSYPIETLRSAAMQKYIVEWASPNFHRPEYWPFLSMVLVALAVLSWSRARTRPRDLILLVVSLYAGLCSVRMIPLFVFIAIPLIARRLAEGWQESEGQRPVRTGARRKRSGVTALFHAAIVLAMAAFASAHVAWVIRRQPQAEFENFPVRAIAFLKAHPPAGRIFNDYDWGGYLIWRLSPSARVFVDGRADLYGQFILDQYANTYGFKNNWKEGLRDWNIEMVFVPTDSALASGLRSAPGWRVAYEDSQATVLISSR
jgi:hypothetical protein